MEEEKIKIVLEGMRGEETIAAICPKDAIHANNYFKWGKEFTEAGMQRLSGDTLREATRDEVVELRRMNDLLKRDLAFHIVDQHKLFILESSVYRILKKAGLITSPAHIVLSAGKEFEKKTNLIYDLKKCTLV
jgi:transposase-like protein